MIDKKTRLEIAEYSKPSLATFFLHASLQWGVIAGAVALYLTAPTIATFLVSSIAIGIALHGLAVMGHDAVHFCITRRKWLNDVLGNLLCFFPVGLTVSAYREFHFPHHKDPTGANDPEMPLRRDLGPQWVPSFSMAKGYRLWFLSYFGFSLKELVVFVKAMPMGRVIDRLGCLVFWGAAVSVAYSTSNLSVVGLWVFALATTYFSHLRIQGWHEHSLSHTNEVMTSRYSLPHPLYRLLLPKNVWLHYEHHKYPNVPFYHLEKVRELDREERVFSLHEMIEAEEHTAAPSGGTEVVPETESIGKAA